MKPSEALDIHRNAVREMVQRYHATNPRVFGSVLHQCDTEGSDLDLLVEPTSMTTLLDIARIQGGLESILGVSVDVVTPNALPERMREKILMEAVPV